VASTTQNQKLDTDNSGPEKIPAQGVCAAEASQEAERGELIAPESRPGDVGHIVIA
jgi:hypothetical protein